MPSCAVGEMSGAGPTGRHKAEKEGGSIDVFRGSSFAKFPLQHFSRSNARGRLRSYTPAANSQHAYRRHRLCPSFLLLRLGQTLKKIWLDYDFDPEPESGHSFTKSVTASILVSRHPRAHREVLRKYALQQARVITHSSW